MAKRIVDIFDDDDVRQKALKRVQRDQDVIAALFKNVVDTFRRMADFVWRNPYGLTPQEIFDLYGDKAVDLCRLSSAAQAMVETYTGTRPAVVPEGYDLQYNADGTVTVLGGPPKKEEPPQAEPAASPAESEPSITVVVEDGYSPPPPPEDSIQQGNP